MRYDYPGLLLQHILPWLDFFICVAMLDGVRVFVEELEPEPGGDKRRDDLAQSMHPVIRRMPIVCPRLGIRPPFLRSHRLQALEISLVQGLSHIVESTREEETPEGMMLYDVECAAWPQIACDKLGPAVKVSQPTLQRHRR